MKCRLLFFLVLLSCVNDLFSQDASLVLKKLADSFPQERVHIHFDKEAYVSGETIWFKAYLFNGFVPSDLSTNFYVELRNDKGKLVDRKTLPIFSGTAIGSIAIPDTLVTGQYLFRAYTPWMLNFREEFLFEKPIVLYKSGKQTSAPLSQSPRYSLQFFPEGGDLIKSIVNVVAFKGTNQFGEPVDIKGRLIDAAGNELASLQSVHDGMGSFGFIPTGDMEYFAEVSFADGAIQKIPLPRAQEKGWGLQVREESPTRRRVAIVRPATGSVGKMLLVGQMQQQLLLAQPLTIEGSSALLSIDLSAFPTGILQLTLLNEENLPVAERLLFVNKEDFWVNLDFSKQESSVKPKAKNEFQFSVPDSISGSFSVSVVDEDKVLHTGKSDDIVSRFLLTSDLKGYIHHPEFYLSKNDKPTRAALDLLMMTHGWRRFSCKESLVGNFPRIIYRDKNYIQISGTILSERTQKPVTSGEVNFIYRTKDSLTDFLQVVVDDKGRFELDNLSYQDSAEFSFQLNSKKNKEKQLKIILDKDSTDYSFFTNRIDHSIQPFNILFTQSDSAEIIYSYLRDSSGKVQELTAVIVTARKKKPIEELNERYTTGLFSSMTMAKVYDLVNNDPGAGALHVFQYIQGRVPGLRVVSQGFPPSYTVFSGRAMSLTGGPIPVPLYLDEMPATSQQLVSLSMREVAMIKYFPTGFMGNPGIGSTQALVVYTKKGGDAIKISKDFLNAFSYPGYSVVREFYSPDYEINPEKQSEIDRRTTIVWQPELKQDPETGKYTIRFFNSDKATKLKLVLEGMLSDGRLVHKEMSITK